MEKNRTKTKKAEEPALKAKIINRHKKETPGFLSKVYLILILLFIQVSALKAVCTPQSATLCAAVDDYAWIYLNGTLLDTFTYCDIGWTCSPKCINFTPAQLALLLPTGNILATYVQNTSCCELWGSWSLDIGCTDGTTVITTSNDGGLQMFSDTTCTSPNPSPTPSGGYQWYQPPYVMNGAWIPPVNMTGKKFGQRIYDPATGNLCKALSYSASMSTDCGAIWFRGTFALTPVSTPVAPAFTITKSANPSTNIGLNSPWLVTFTLHICNTGGGTFGTPVVIQDNWNDAVDGWQYNWPYEYTDPIFGDIQYSGSGKTATITFANGFNATSCFDYVYSVTMYSGQPTYCANWHNIADLTYLAQPTVVASVTLQDVCPPPPVLTLVKSANPTTGIQNGTAVSFNMHICNTGGAAWNGAMTLVDDWTNNTDSWQYDGPYYTGNPATGISGISASNSGHTTTYTITFTTPGFTGCVDVPMNMHMTTQNPNNCSWYNKASLSYFASPVVVSTVNMADYCSPTFTITPTRTATFTISPTRTVSLTPTKTMTLTPTMSYTNTPIFTPTLTPTQISGISLSKSESESTAVFGDTVTYCITVSNGSSADVVGFHVWDTIPSVYTYIGCDSGCSKSGSLLTWTMTVPANSYITVCFWGKITSYTLFEWNKEFLELLKERGNLYGWNGYENMVEPEMTWPFGAVWNGKNNGRGEDKHG
jgi:uncharacterized repeat protein (TIGR01451 family)